MVQISRASRTTEAGFRQSLGDGLYGGLSLLLAPAREAG